MRLESKTKNPRIIVLFFLLIFFGLAFILFGKLFILDRLDSIENAPVYISPPLVFPKKYRIGFMTDAHARTDKKGRLKPKTEEPIKEFAYQMNNRFKPDFVLDGGDFIDGTRRYGTASERDYDVLEKFFQKIEAPSYKVLGNHDLRGFSRQRWIEKTGNTNSFYYFDYDEKLRIIVFDSNLLTSDTDEDSLKKIAYDQELAWLEKTLADSQDKKVIVFSHHPLVPALKKANPLEPIERLNKLFSAYHVRAVFSGHVEVLYYENIGGVDYFVTPGFYRSELTGFPWVGSFSEIYVGLKNQVTLYYKKTEEDKEYQHIIVPSPAYYAIEKEERAKVNFLAPDTE